MCRYQTETPTLITNLQLSKNPAAFSAFSAISAILTTACSHVSVAEIAEKTSYPAFHSKDISTDAKTLLYHFYK